ncbi:FUSC family protein [Neolewinella litorea]|uniref:FUSC family protein n=1 Tax=Neolewinella litorea TaxID=2562452 RepID=UPI001455E0B8|nr:FUSC family protein [Neolewinella litorea]
MDRIALVARRRIIRLLKDYAFSRGVLMVLAILSVLVLSTAVADLPTGVSCAVGVFLVSICDLPGNKLDHLKNMVYGLLLAVVNIVLIQLAHTAGELHVLALPLLVFVTAYLSVFGKRAGLVSFSGLLALVLAYAFPKAGWDIVLSALYIGLGGLWFILLNVIVHPFRYKRYRLGLLNDCIQLTADYLELKSRQVVAQDPDHLWPEVIRTHNRINEIRKVLTDYFLGQSPKQDTLGEQSREGVLYLELVDLVELGAAVPVRPEARQPDTSNTTAELAGILEQVATSLRRVAFKSRNFVSAHPDTLAQRLASLGERRAEGPAPDERGEHYLYILYDNLEKQIGKLRTIERLADTRGLVSHAIFSREAKSRLRPPADTDWSVLRENFSMDSAAFRHSLRLSLVVLLGYLIGRYFSLQNAYWIILTVVVIMRPTYVQSKDRSVERTLGTLAGAVVAAGVVWLTDSHLVYAVIGAAAMPFVFTYLDRDYRISAFFVTLNLVFTYALLHPDAYTVIAYRVVDTVIGAALSFVASRLLWPAWESRSIPKLMVRALDGIGNYLRQESNLYLNREDDSLAYRIARRHAFVYLGELDDSYARALREPVRKRAATESLSRIVTCNHQILSSIAYLGTYLQHHPVSVSHEHFSALINDLTHRLEACRDLLETGHTRPLPPRTETDGALAYFTGPAESEGQQREKRLFLREYRYLRGLIDGLQRELPGRLALARGV